MTWPIDVQALEQAIVRNCSPHFGCAKTRQSVHLSRLVHSRSAREPERSKRAQTGPPRSCEVLPTSSFKRRSRNPHSGLEALRSPRLRVSPP